MHNPATGWITAAALLLSTAMAQSPPAAGHWPPLQAGSLELTAHWGPLTDTKYGFEQQPLIKSLAVATPRASYTTAQFAPFLPSGPVAVGSSWKVEAAAVLPFLRQLHPGATVNLHHDQGTGISAHGAWACLRVLDASCAEIVLRVHADFCIDGDGDVERSSWFTPAFFRGRLWIDRQKGTVEAFELGVPASRANVDVNIATESHTIADIGSVQRLQLVSGAIPEPPASAQQIGETEADQLLERRFYPFAALDWLPLPQARARALATGKPMHVIALFGTLTDESC